MHDKGTPQELILSTMVGFWQAHALETATQLRLADFLSHGPLPIDALAKQAQVNASAAVSHAALESIGIL